MAGENREDRPSCRLTPELTRKIGEEIRNFRNAHNITQSEFADSICADLSTVRKWECGKSVPTNPLRKVIKHLYGRDIVNQTIAEWRRSHPMEKGITQPAQLSFPWKKDEPAVGRAARQAWFALYCAIHDNWDEFWEYS